MIFQIVEEEAINTSNEPEDKWLMDISFFLSTRLPPDQLSCDEEKRLAVKSWNFCLLQDLLYHKGANGIWRRCVRADEKLAVLQEAHCGIVDGHYIGDITTKKVWQSVLWWPMTIKDALQYCQECELCQRMGQLTSEAWMLHQLILPLEPFQKWGIDFVNPFKPSVARMGN